MLYAKRGIASASRLSVCLWRWGIVITLEFSENNFAVT